MNQIVATVGPFYPGAADAAGDGVLDFVRPQDGQVAARIADCGPDIVDAAVAAARSSYRAHRKSPLSARLAWLKASAAALRGAASEIAAIISEDVGKPIKAATFEANRAGDFVDASIAAAPQLGGEVLALDTVAAGSGLTGFTRRVPYGVVAGIVPFNAPVNLLLQKVVPALAMGNAVVIKPSLPGTRVALRVARLFAEAGLPEGLFSVVTGDKRAALALAAHPNVDAVTFTGGTAAGNELARAAGAKKFVAELGSNAANIVFADADLPRAAIRIASAGFEASGQQCISAQRILVERSVLETFLPLLVDAASALKVGPASDPATDLGPMVHAGAADRVMAMVADAVERGAECPLPPVRDGATVSPAILVDVSRESRLWNEEVFGPVVVVVPFDGVDEAIALANDSEFGLQGAVFTRDIGTALRCADDIEVGSLWVNEASRFRLDMYPFGGVKQSGTGREGVRYAMEELSQLKFIGLSERN